MPEQKESFNVEEVFQRVVPTYDRLNHLFTLNIDRRWRKRLVKRSEVRPSSRVLDVCTGTADVAIALARRFRGVSVDAIDLSEAMIEVARSKVRRAGLSDSITVAPGDALGIPFADRSFDVVCNSFGLRTLSDPARGVREMARVARVGGRVLILEFAPPPEGLLGSLYAWYLRSFMPALGGLLSGYRTSYSYLYESVSAFLKPAELLEIMRTAGLREVGSERLSGGIAYLYVGSR